LILGDALKESPRFFGPQTSKPPLTLGDFSSGSTNWGQTGPSVVSSHSEFSESQVRDLAHASPQSSYGANFGCTKVEDKKYFGHRK
jgi:hypothetical protein